MSVFLPGGAQAFGVPEFVPDGFLALFTALNRVGRSLFGDEWTDHELIARDDWRIAADERARQDKAAKLAKQKQHRQRTAPAKHAKSSNPRRGHSLAQLASLVTDDQGSESASHAHKLPPPPFKDESDEKAASKRCQNAWEKLRQGFYGGRLPAQALTGDGRRFSTPEFLWGAKDASLILRSGRAEFWYRGGPVPYKVDGWVIIKETDLVSFLSGAPSEATESADLKDHAQVHPESDPIPPSSDSPPEYSSPYMKLMQQAIREFEISDSMQPKAEALEDWFKLKEVDGLQVSERLAKSMATLLRLPRMQKGGTHPQRKRRMG